MIFRFSFGSAPIVKAFFRASLAKGNLEESSM
jgi:hypothetical protein